MSEDKPEGVGVVQIQGEPSKEIESTDSDQPEKPKLKIISPELPVRVKLPDERVSITHKFVIVGGDSHWGIGPDGEIVKITKDVDVYFTVGFYPDKKLGELFIRIGKEGDDKSGIYDSFAIAISLALQYGVPIDVFIDKFEHTRFEPSGPTKNPDIAMAKSILDYIFKWLKRYSEKTRKSIIPNVAVEEKDNEPSGCSEEAESGQTEGSGSSAVRVCEKEGSQDKGADEAG